MTANELYDALQTAYSNAQKAQVAARNAYAAMRDMDPSQDTRWYNEQVIRNAEINEWYETEVKRILRKAGFGRG